MMIEDWRTGEYYELAVELGPRSDARLLAALRAAAKLGENPLVLWSEAGDSVEVTEAAFLSGSHLYGSHTVAGRPLRYGVCAVREDDGPDWFDLYFPLGALAAAGVELPHMLDGAAFKPALDEFLVTVGRAIYQSAPFQLGLIGWEVSGYAYARDVPTTGPEASPGIIHLWSDSPRTTRSGTRSG